MLLLEKSPRRKKKFWKKDETELLIKCVDKYDTHWSYIIKNNPIFTENGRTQIDLKDKWRNILKSRQNKGKKLQKKVLYLDYDSGCGYCIKAKELLKKNKIKYTEIEVTDDNEDMIYKKIDNKTKKYRSFPMIFKNNKFIGGFSDLDKNNL